MKRICFDIGSSYWHSLTSGVALNEPSEARAFFEGRTFRFHAATAFDSSARKYRHFTDHKKLFDFLLRADEIVTYNGRVCDFIVLESLVGEKEMAGLWRKPHHDMIRWSFVHKVCLKKASEKLLPRMFPSWDAVKDERLARIRELYSNEFVADHLADSYRDTKFTYALFHLYEKSGDTGNTFLDG